jgi:multimeric flavodoxin WrbA
MKINDQKNFSKYWKGKKSDKYFSKYVPRLSTEKTFEILINEMNTNEDYRKKNYEDRLLTMQKIFGNCEEQYSVENLGNEIKNAINIGRQRAGV